MAGIDSLLGDRAREDVLGGHWSQSPQLLRGGAADLCATIPLQKVTALAAAGLRHPSNRATLIVEDASVDYTKLGQLQRASKQRAVSLHHLDEICGDATLIVNGIHNFDDDIGQLMRALFDGFAEHMSMNMYYSPAGGGPGLGMHYDRWEIFASQLVGAKRWRVWPPTIDFPVDDRREDAAEVALRPPSFDAELGAGDVLYLPRGAWHSVTPTDVASLHLTIGVHAKKGVDLVDWLLDEASKDVAMRQNMPSPTLPGGSQRQLAAASAAIAAMRNVLERPDAARQFLRFRFKHEHILTFGLPEVERSRVE